MRISLGSVLFPSQPDPARITLYFEFDTVITKFKSLLDQAFILASLKEPLREVMSVEFGEEEVLQSDVLVPAPDGKRAADRPKGYAA